MELRSKKIFVTGAGGFIGSNLVEILAEGGYEVTAMVHYNSANSWGNLELLPDDLQKRIRVVSGDVCDPAFLRKLAGEHDVVLHLAALISIPYSYVAPSSYFMTNVQGTINILEAVRDTKVERVIVTSTSETYGTARYVPIDEKHPLQPQSPYSASKIGADAAAESFFRAFELPVSILRPFNTFGPRQSARAIIPTIISQVLSGKNPLVLGSLDPVRDLTFVSDTAEAFIKIAECDEAVGQTVNIGRGSGVSVGELAETIMRLTGKHCEIVQESSRVRPEKSEVMKLICDASKAKQLMGWEPQVSLDEGLKRVIDFMKKNMERYKPKLYNI